MFRELKKFLILLLAGVCLAMPAHAKRLALVLGNDQYIAVSKLQKAGNDASAMARELRAAGFTVQLHRDLNYRGMVKAIEVFAANIAGGDEVVVFFAGHGVQIKSGSYLLPTDIEATSESEVEKTAYELNALIDKISEAKPAFSLVMVDACRNNPLKSKGRSVGATRGLSAVEPPKGQMVVFSASRGQEALDRLSDKDPNPNGVFTREFIKRMKKPGVRIEDLMREVQDAVEKLADSISHEQRPAIYNESRGNFYFFGPTTVQTFNNTVPLVSTQTKDENFWEDVKAVGNKEAYEAYLLSYPTGRYAHLAKANIVRLTTANSAPAPAPAPAPAIAQLPVNKPTSTNKLVAKQPLKVAFAYVGPIGDGGWTFSHEVARQSVEQAFGDKVVTTFVEKVPESADAERVFRDTARQGNKLIFGTTFGYMEPMLKVAADLKDVKFEHALGYKTAENMRTYDSRTYEGAYLAGVIAGKMTKTNVLGVVASIPIPEVIRNINSYTMGAQSVNPKIKTKVVWVNEWFNPPKESEAATSLINGGADVLMQNTDSSAVLQTAEKMGKRAFGWDSDMTAYGPKAHLGSAVNNWGPYYVKAVGEALEGKWTTGQSWWGVKEGAIDMVNVAADVPKDTKKRIDEIKAGLKDGSFSIWKGPIVDQAGKVMLAKDTVADDKFLGGVMFYVKGVEGKIPGK
jgi:simple sugar transport system substrate-binding protein